MLLKEIWGDDDQSYHSNLVFPNDFDPDETDADLVELKKKFFKIAGGFEVGVRLVDAVTPGSGVHRTYEMQLISHFRDCHLCWAELDYLQPQHLDRFFNVACQKIAQLSAEDWDELNTKFHDIMEDLLTDFKD